MKSRHLLLAAAISLGLSACGNSPTPTEPAATTADTAPAAEAPATTPAEATPATAAPAATGSKPAVVENCAAALESNDAMQFNADAITVPASCSQFTINLKHVGKLAANVMGHNVVISKESDMAGISTDGMADPTNHVKPGDTRALAFTRIIGGGESASVTFDVAKLKDGGPYKFFCSFPGHLALMQGSIQVQ